MDYLSKWFNRKFDEAEDDDRQVEYIVKMLYAQLRLCYRRSLDQQTLVQHIKPVRVEDLV